MTSALAPYLLARGTPCHLIRADAPSHAYNHQRRLLAGEPGHAGEGECQACPAEILRHGSLPDMVRLAASLGADVTPRPGPPETPGRFSSTGSGPVSLIPRPYGPVSHSVARWCWLTDWRAGRC